MSQQPDLELLPNEDKILLAIKALNLDKTLSKQHAATMYRVSRRTLRDQRAKTALQRNTHPNSLKLLRHKEDTIVQYIRKLDEQGFAPTLSYVQEIANQLLAAHGSNQVGEKWARNLVRRKPKIKS
jgi:hypothetical protein